MEPAILMHVCCAPCAAPSVELVLRDRDRWSNIVFFYSNSNIYPREEYDRRLQYVRQLGEIHGITVMADDYDHDAWRDAIKGFENEPERGARCRLCFKFNLCRAARAAAELGNCAFTTTLTVSPYKDNATIFAAAEGLTGFVPYDFKRDHGFQRGIELSHQYHFYRQKYCGCEFSLRDRQKK